MEATVMTQRGQISVPAELRKRYNFKGGQRFVWLDDGDFIKLIPVPNDPIRALKGISKGENLTESLLEYRRGERARDK